MLAINSPDCLFSVKTIWAGKNRKEYFSRETRTQLNQFAPDFKTIVWKSIKRFRKFTRAVVNLESYDSQIWNIIWDVFVHLWTNLWTLTQSGLDGIGVFLSSRKNHPEFAWIFTRWQQFPGQWKNTLAIVYLAVWPSPSALHRCHVVGGNYLDISFHRLCLESKV